MDSIYGRIWSLDRKEGNGARVASVTDDGTIPSEQQADIVLDEQVKADGSRQIDLATRPLFRRVSRSLLERPTYRAFRSLLDNYVVNFRAVEVSTPEEDEEVREFMAAIGETAVMRAAYDYVKSQLRRGIGQAQFLDEVRRMWFQRYTNYFRGRSTHHCSGFEHVFVGEGKYRPRSGAGDTKGEISGYHSWIKFHLDESAGRVNYLGHKYDLGGGQGPDDPRVVTLQMVWTHQDFDAEIVAQLFKPKGGFFVGSSPEAEIALGTVALFESAAGLVENDRVRVQLGEEGGAFDLVIYRNVTENGERGQFIRSIFPILMDDGSDQSAGGATVVRPVRPELRNPGPVFIASAMPNPPTPDDRRGEWVQLENAGTDAVDLEGWELRDRMQRPWPLSGTLDPGGTRRFVIERRPDGMALRNKGGLITLHEPRGSLRAAVGYRSADEGRELQFERT